VVVVPDQKSAVVEVSVFNHSAFCTRVVDNDFVGVALADLGALGLGNRAGVLRVNLGFALAVLLVEMRKVVI
jgi:hypothetical protein